MIYRPSEHIQHTVELVLEGFVSDQPLEGTLDMLSGQPGVLPFLLDGQIVDMSKVQPICSKETHEPWSMLLRPDCLVGAIHPFSHMYLYSRVGNLLGYLHKARWFVVHISHEPRTTPPDDKAIRGVRYEAGG